MTTPTDRTGPTVRSLAYLDVEVAPDEAVYAGHAEDPYVIDIQLTAEYAAIPDRMRVTLQHLIDNPDGGGTCAAIGCDSPVGYVLWEDDENPSGGGLVWRWTTLVDDDAGDGAFAVCEDCAPTNLYTGP